MKRVGGREGKMEGHCSTGQSPQWAVVPMEEEEGGGGGGGGGGEEEEKEEREEEDPGKDGKRKQKEIYKCWQ